MIIAAASTIIVIVIIGPLVEVAIIITIIGAEATFDYRSCFGCYSSLEAPVATVAAAIATIS